MSKIVYEFDDETKSVSMMYDNNGLYKTKTVSINDFVESVIASSQLKAFDEYANREYGAMFTEMDNCRLIQTIKEGNDTFIYVVQFLPKRMPITIYDTFFDDIGLPNTLFAIKVYNERYVNGKIVCVKDRCVTETSKLYKYPYSNASLKHICLGQNKISNRLDSNTVLEVPRLFYSMPNTACSFSPKSNSLCLEYRDLVLYTQGKEFNDNLLMPTTDYTTYKEWIEGVK